MPLGPDKEEKVTPGGGGGRMTTNGETCAFANGVTKKQAVAAATAHAARMDLGANLLSFTISFLGALAFVMPGIERARIEIRLRFSIHGGQYPEFSVKVKVIRRGSKSAPQERIWAKKRLTSGP